MEKNKRNKIIGLSIGIFVVLIIVVSSTYAYWQITRTQETPNDIVAACLNLDLADASAAIDLDSAWPISDEEGKNLTGYTFTVTNNCNEEINYIVGLNRVEESNYLLDSSIKLQLDDNSTHVYGDLSDVEYSDAENTEYTARVSKQVSVETIGAKGTNTHTIKVWVSDEAPVTEQSKTFLGQVFITGGQGIEVPELNECFTIASNGTILSYDESCGSNVKIPAEINGIKVKNIESAAFWNANMNLSWCVDKITGEEIGVIYLKDHSMKEEVLEYLKEEDYVVLGSLEEYAAFEWEKYDVIDEGGPGFIIPEEDVFGGDDVYLLNIENLDLSEAIYLEKISFAAFLGGYTGDFNINDTCELVEDPKGNYYQCLGSLKEVIFPQNGSLTTIESYAFLGNQITKVIIPSSVSHISWEAFGSNDNLTQVIIKNNESDVEFADDAFPSTATVTYNPNYTE